MRQCLHLPFSEIPLLHKFVTKISCCLRSWKDKRMMKTKALNLRYSVTEVQYSSMTLSKSTQNPEIRQQFQPERNVQTTPKSSTAVQYNCVKTSLHHASCGWHRQQMTAVPDSLTKTCLLVVGTYRCIWGFRLHTNMHGLIVRAYWSPPSCCISRPWQW